MNTPLIELIAKLEGYLTDPYIALSSDHISALRVAKKDATELLEKEREVIGAAYTAGGLDGVCVGIAKQNERAFSSEFDYFTKTFTDESK